MNKLDKKRLHKNINEALGLFYVSLVGIIWAGIVGVQYIFCILFILKTFPKLFLVLSIFLYIVDSVITLILWFLLIKSITHNKNGKRNK